MEGVLRRGLDLGQGFGGDDMAGRTRLLTLLAVWMVVVAVGGGHVAHAGNPAGPSSPPAAGELGQAGGPPVIEVGTGAREKTEISVYSGWAVIWEVRKVSLPAGEAVLYVDGMPPTVEPGSVHMKFSDPGSSGPVEVGYIVLEDSALAAVVTSKAAAARTMEIIYTAKGFSWHADYTALVPSLSKPSVELRGWAGIANSTAAWFDKASVTLCGEVDGQAVLYRIAKPLEIPPNGEVHGAIIEPRTLTGSWIYLVEHQGGRHPETYVPAKDVKTGLKTIEIANDEKAGLGIRAPQGSAAVYEVITTGGLRVGPAGTLPAMNPGVPLRICVDREPHVTSEKTRTDFRKIGTGAYEEAFQIRIRNSSDTPVDVVVVEKFAGDWVIIQSNPSNWVKTKPDTAEFRVRVAAKSEADVLYRVRTSFPSPLIQSQASP